MNQKKYVLGLVISIIALAVGVSYAYFTATFQNLGIRETSITLAELGSLKLTASEATYTSGGQYPGDMAVQKFIVEPVSKGSGIYELDLTGVIDESIFADDVEIQLYKSLDNTEVTITEGELEKEGENFSRVDTLVTNGLTPIYTGTLKNGLNILLQEDFEIIEESGVLKVRENSTSSSYSKYTFFLIYNYKNNGNQNSQMGSSFAGTISGKIIDKKIIPALDTIESLQELNPSITVAKMTSINPDFSRIAPQNTPGVFTEEYYSLSSNEYITYADDAVYDPITGHYTLVNPNTCKYQDCYMNLVNKMVVRQENGSFGNIENVAFDQSADITGNEVDKIIEAHLTGTRGHLDIIAYKKAEYNEEKEGTWQPQTSGIFELEDDYGISYYYRGDVTNNYVKFNNYYWRIIRINGDGSIRMIYSGDANIIDSLPNKIEVLTNGYDDYTTQYLITGKSNYSLEEDDNTYVGYMYGTPQSNNYQNTHANTHDSPIKTYLENWYETHIKDTIYEQYIADNLFCNDRSLASEEVISFFDFTLNAFENNNTIYGPYGRQYEQMMLNKRNQATLKCKNKSDAFTMSDTIHGNGLLTYPIGLITIDEANIAGGVLNQENNAYYLASNNWYWTMSPMSYEHNYSLLGQINQNGQVATNAPANPFDVRPVISLKPGSINAGNGTISNPFRIE